MRRAEPTARRRRRAPSPVCSQVAAMVSVEDFADRAAPRRSPTARRSRSGNARVRWLDAPHVPHGWETGLLFEETHAHAALRRPLHPGRHRRDAPLTESDILGPSEAFRKPMDYYSHSKNAGADPRAARRDRADHARLHARQRLAAETAARLLRRARPLARPPEAAARSARGEAAAGRVDRHALRGRAGTRPPARTAPRARAASATARGTRRPEARGPRSSRRRRRGRPRPRPRPPLPASTCRS